MVACMLAYRFMHISVLTYLTHTNYVHRLSYTCPSTMIWLMTPSLLGRSCLPACLCSQSSTSSVAVRFCLPACLCSQASSASVAVRYCLLALIVVSISLLPIVSSCLLVTVPYMAILPIVSLSPVPLRNISSSMSSQATGRGILHASKGPLSLKLIVNFNC